MKKTVFNKLLPLIVIGAFLISNYELPDDSLSQEEIFHSKKILFADGDDDEEDPPIFVPNGMDTLIWRNKQIMDSVFYVDENIPSHLFIPMLSI